jgi:hypothetical protein
MITIEAFTHTAVFDGVRWTSSDRDLLVLLETGRPALERAYSPAYGRRDLWLARQAVAQLGDHARIVTASPAPAYPKDTIF